MTATTAIFTGFALGLALGASVVLAEPSPGPAASLPALGFTASPHGQ